jgi:hypothetical protein
VQLALERVDCRGDGLRKVERIERAADAVVKLRIADCDEARQDQPAAAYPDEGLGQRADGAIVWKKDSAAGKGVGGAAMLADEAIGKRIGKAAVRRDCIDRWG